MKINRISFYSRYFVFTFLCIFVLSLSSNAQTEIKPEECSQSKENLKKCFDLFVGHLENIKAGAENKVAAVKRSEKNNELTTKATELAEVKRLYEDAKGTVETATKVFKKKPYDFTNIKIEVERAVTKYRNFNNAANVLLTGGPATNLGIFDFIIDFGCQILNVPDLLCDYIKDLFAEYKVKKTRWKKWNEIKV
jgi:hypothetical protein